MAASDRLRRFWTFCVVVVGTALIYLTFSKDLSLAEHLTGGIGFGALLLFAFFSEYIDSSLGMGYGTTLTPVLLIMGFRAMDVVPAILFSEFLSGVSAGLLHHRLGNVDLGRGTRSRKVTGILAICSVVGTVVAVVAAVRLPASIVRGYIGVMILGIGLFIILSSGSRFGFSWAKIIGLGSIAAFNKGISGGGYGPLVTGGQVVIGVPEKNAVGITSLAEGLVCLVGLTLYLLLEGPLAWHLAVPLATGAMLSVPAATVTVKVLPEALLRRSIGYATMFLGTLSLIKIL